MADVFISYCSVDRDRVAALARALEHEGLSVWWDRALVAGASYENEIDGALAQAKAVIVAWTPASAASDWVRSESDGARVDGKLVPVLLQATRIPRPFDRLHTIDMSKWSGDRGNQGFPEAAEAVKALVEGRAAKPVPWRRRITLAALGSALFAIIVFSGALIQLGYAAHFLAPDAFAAAGARDLSSERSSAATQAGFERALKALATSFSLRTQNALSGLRTANGGNRAQALEALRTLAEDQSQAIDTQMQNAGSLWRQLGLLQFSSNPTAAREALEQADRYLPDDPAVLTALSALYHSEGRNGDGESVSRRALALGNLSPNEEARVRQVVGEALLDQGDAAGARQQFDLALARSDSVSDDSLSADINIDLANAVFVSGDTQAALQQLADNETFAASIPYPEAVARINYYAAQMLIADNRLDDAEAKLRAIAAGDNTFLALSTALTTAELAARRGDPRRAADIAANVRRQAQALQLTPIINDAMARQALYLAMAGNVDEARPMAQTAALAFQSLGDPASAAIAAAVEAYAAFLQSAPNARSCAPLRAISAPPGYAAGEISFIRSLAHCAS